MEIWKKNHNFLDIGMTPEFSHSALGGMTLMKDLLQKDVGHLTEIQVNGTTEKNMDYFTEKMLSLGFRLIYKYSQVLCQDTVWLSNDSVVEIILNVNTTPNIIDFKGCSQNEELIMGLQKFTSDLLLPQVRQGHIFAIISSGGNLRLQSIGNAGIPLRRENYVSNVIKHYDEAVEDLNSCSPSGRIVILEGEPGTGKTHMIKSLLLSVPDAMFVLISPDMLTSLDSPELLPLLMGYKHSHCPNGPIVLILEDADACLVKRGGDNINAIQALLNLSDGILGNLLDLRIIATTNAKKLEIEPAILRNGRLSKRLEVGPLDLTTAFNVFESLVPGKEYPNKERLILDNRRVPVKIILADVYALAREHGWKPEERKLAQTANSILDIIDE